LVSIPALWTYGACIHTPLTLHPSSHIISRYLISFPSSTSSLSLTASNQPNLIPPLRLHTNTAHPKTRAPEKKNPPSRPAEIPVLCKQGKKNKTGKEASIRYHEPFARVVLFLPPARTVCSGALVSAIFCPSRSHKPPNGTPSPKSPSSVKKKKKKKEATKGK
jgi:hypothetical protein